MRFPLSFSFYIVELKLSLIFVAFNMIGYIFAVEREDGQSVTVEFHDRSAHIPQKFDDLMKYDLASLGTSPSLFPPSPSR